MSYYFIAKLHITELGDQERVLEYVNKMRQTILSRAE